MTARLTIPENTPVIVFASYRTGSTALCDAIARQNALHNFDEALHPGEHPFLAARKKRFLDFLDNAGERFVIKVMPDHISDEYRPLVERLAGFSYLIRITRRSVIKQIASYYIASTSNIWHQTQDSPKREYDIVLDQALMRKAWDYIIRMNRALSEIDYAYHLDLSYESLSLRSQFAIYRKPGNYGALLDAIANMMATDSASAP